MKRLKYAVILLLGLSMATMMTSCTKDNAQLIVGKWEIVYHLESGQAIDPSNLDLSLYDNHGVGEIWEFSSDGVWSHRHETGTYLIQGDVLTLLVGFTWNFDIYELTNSSLKFGGFAFGYHYYEFKKVN